MNYTPIWVVAFAVVAAAITGSLILGVLAGIASGVGIKWYGEGHT